MIKLTITNQAKLEASWEIIKDDIGIDTGDQHYSKYINSVELKLLYKPFVRELRQVFGDLPEITDFDCGLTHLFNHSDYKRRNFNARKSADVKQARKAFDVLTTWILKLVGYTSRDHELILLKSEFYKNAKSSKDYIKKTFTLK